MRFDADPEIAYFWKKSLDNELTSKELKSFQDLVTHEYVESGLMKLGLTYRSTKNSANNYRPTPDAFGAHDWAPKPSYRISPWEHLPTIGK